MPDRPPSSRHTGQVCENIARDYLEQQGLLFLQAGYQCRYGEVDLVMHDCRQDQIVFVEVRARSTQDYGDPVETVTKHKANKQLKTALLYLQRHFTSEPGYRFDIIAINITNASRLPNPAAYRLDWYQGAIDESAILD